MDTYEVELKPAEPDGFAAIVPALPGLLVLGQDVDEVLERARAAIAFHAGLGELAVRLIVRRQHHGELLNEPPSLSCEQGDLHARELVGGRPRLP
jgi:predicted RNase H-like HicB family nuclease